MGTPNALCTSCTHLPTPWPAAYAHTWRQQEQELQMASDLVQKTSPTLQDLENPYKSVYSAPLQGKQREAVRIQPSFAELREDMQA